MNQVLLSLMSNTQNLLEAIEQGTKVLQVAVNQSTNETQSVKESQDEAEDTNKSPENEVAKTEDIVKLVESVSVATTIGRQSLAEAMNYASKVLQETDVFIKLPENINLREEVQTLLVDTFKFSKVTVELTSNDQRQVVQPDELEEVSLNNVAADAKLDEELPLESSDNITTDEYIDTESTDTDSIDNNVAESTEGCSSEGCTFNDSDDNSTNKADDNIENETNSENIETSDMSNDRLAQSMESIKTSIEKMNDLTKTFDDASKTKSTSNQVEAYARSAVDMSILVQLVSRLSGYYDVLIEVSTDYKIILSLV